MEMLGVDLAVLPLRLLAASSGPRLAKLVAPFLSRSCTRRKVSVQAGYVLANPNFWCGWFRAKYVSEPEVAPTTRCQGIFSAADARHSTSTAPGSAAANCARCQIILGLLDRRQMGNCMSHDDEVFPKSNKMSRRSWNVCIVYNPEPWITGTTSSTSFAGCEPPSLVFYSE